MISFITIYAFWRWLACAACAPTRHVLLTSMLALGIIMRYRSLIHAARVLGYSLILVSVHEAEEHGGGSDVA